MYGVPGERCEVIRACIVRRAVCREQLLLERVRIRAVEIHVGVHAVAVFGGNLEKIIRNDAGRADDVRFEAELPDLTHQ